MRLWHYKLLPLLPNKWIQSQWRECLSIKRRWEQNKQDSRLVLYVRNYDECYFIKYVDRVVDELQKRGIRYNKKLLEEIHSFNKHTTAYISGNYPEHNDRYLIQCYYNLQEKYDRGIITEEEWTKITNEINIDYLIMCK